MKLLQRGPVFFFLGGGGALLSLHCCVQASVVAGSLVVVNWFICPMACGILVPRPEIELASPAMEGGFLTPETPGKS